jgi:hypothetical protein
VVKNVIPTQRLQGLKSVFALTTILKGFNELTTTNSSVVCGEGERCHQGKWYDFFKTYENNPKNKNMLVETI